MKLKSFGCSLIFGNELSDYNEKTYPIRHSELTWPALLAKKMNMSYECHAYPGIGNLQIFEKILNESSLDESVFFVISWTWIDRFDYFDQENPKIWSTLRPSSDSALAKTYYQKLHSQYQDKLTALSLISSCITMLKNKNIPFMMTSQDNLIFETAWHYTPAIQQLQHSVKPYFTWFDDLPFIQWCHNKKFKISDRNHPLDLAHSSACEHIFNSFDRQKIVGPAQQVLF